MDNPQLHELTPLATVITLVFGTIAAVALLYARRAVKYLADLAGVKVSEQQQKLIDDAIYQGIAYAEEQAHKYARSLIEDGPANGAQKLEVAAAAARSIAPDALASVQPQDLAIRVEAALQSIRPTAAAQSSIPPFRRSYNPPGGTSLIPRASKLPTEFRAPLAEEEITRPETPSAKR